MAKYIDREAAIKAVEKNDCEGYATWAIRSVPAADVVERKVLDQVYWERDTALHQLAEIGKGLAEKMDDVVERKHGKWVLYNKGFGFTHYCSNCNFEVKEQWIDFYNFYT